MSDYIKREDAIKAIESLQSFQIYSEFGGKRGTMYSAYDIGKAIEMIPSADVVEIKKEGEFVPSVTTAWTDGEASTYVLRMKGKWELVSTTKLYESGLYVDDEIEEKCSLCGCHTFRYETQKENNFCPNCGADMRHPDD